MLTLNANVKARGMFQITKRNVSTGEEKIYKAHNLITDNFISIMCSNQGSYTPVLFDQLNLHVGDSSTEPTTTDTDVGHKLWEITLGSTEVTLLSKTSIRCSATFTIPASTSYVGTIREVGLYSYHKINSISAWRLLTHALLKDAEGNPFEVEKTSLDIITIVYNFEVSIASGNIAAMVYNHKLISFGDLVLKYAFNTFENAIEDDTYIYIPNSTQLNSNQPSIANKVNDPSNSQVRWNAGRLDTNTILNGHFLMGVNFMQQNYGVLNSIKLPNAEVFPEVAITELSIGTGDGTTSEFTPPIPAWKENTEKIYKNGVLLTRDVDYTCDYRHNSPINAELMCSSYLSVIDGAVASSSWYSEITLAPNAKADIVDRYGTSKDVFKITPYRIQKNTAYAPEYLCITADYPLIFELPTDESFLNWGVNTVYFCSYSYADNFTLEYSTDKTNWTIFAENMHNNTNSSSTSFKDNFSYYNKYTVETDVMAKYWRLSCSSSSDLHYWGIMFGHVGQGIKFTTPPANGDLLTMDITVDRPYKDSNHVIDVSAVLQL